MATNESPTQARRFDDLEIAGGDVVIYDTENHRAWIQSDDAVVRDEMA